MKLYRRAGGYISTIPPRQSFILPSKSDPTLKYIVEEDEQGKWSCECVAGSFKQLCRHIRIAQNQIHGQTYRPTIDQSFRQDVSG